MLTLERNHDFQVFVSPKNHQVSSVNPPRFTWPEQNGEKNYTFVLEHTTFNHRWLYENTSSPVQIPQILPNGDYRWYVSDSNGLRSQWHHFSINQTSQAYLPPSAKELFELCSNREQFMMYFDEDIQEVKQESWLVYEKFKRTASFTDLDAIQYPNHYRRGKEEGKRTAIANVRRWIDRDLMSLTLLYKIWGVEDDGQLAVKLLLQLAEWSPEGPASLLRPCTWGDEVGLSLSRNLFLAYHWLSPLLTESEKEYVRPMLVRIAYQMEERLAQDEFKQYPGHSHTSRLPSYLGIAALVLHKEYKLEECERWLNYALMIYQCVLPFYGGEDGSWAEGPFYSSSYSKWHHPFFLSVERLSNFSFYNHPFYQQYSHFAMDFVANNDSIHPFGDGFWCKRDGIEWPGFFAQNPLRIYAERFGSKQARSLCREMERNIQSFDLHLLDVIPTVKQLHCTNTYKETANETEDISDIKYRFYPFAGLGKVQYHDISLAYRASPFGNSSHRHADQGNIALIDNGLGVLIPTGSYGYRFGSDHHFSWTRNSKAHNLPLIDGAGQKLDDESASACVLYEKNSKHWHLVAIDLANTYQESLRHIRYLLFIAKQGLVIIDDIELKYDMPLQWRLHTELASQIDNTTLKLEHPNHSYQLSLLSHTDIKPTCEFGYDCGQGDVVVVSDANPNVTHIEWQLKSAKRHLVVAACSIDTIACVDLDHKPITLEWAEQSLTIPLES